MQVVCSQNKEEKTAPIIMLGDPAGVTDEHLKQVAEAKRFLERWTADEKFRELAAADVKAAGAECGMSMDPLEIKALWDRDAAIEVNRTDAIPLTVKRYREFVKEKLAHRDTLRNISCVPQNPVFKAWRARHINRCWGQFGNVNASMIHAPVSFELNHGCSVGCWFCGLDAPKLSAVFEYNPQNAQLWRETLSVFKKLAGPSAGTGVCYWASEPMDNPDYEKFCCDFHDILGTFPQTTTALPLKDAARTRKLLKLSNERGFWINRFSVLSVEMLHRVHKEFTAEELAFVELVTQNKEANMKQAVSGRARIKMRKDGSLGESEEFNPAEGGSGTITCMSGFIVNMTDRNVKLISPCNSSDRWPVGYWLHAEGNFTDAASLDILVNKMVEKCMPTAVRAADPMRFRPDIKFERMDGGFNITSPFISLKFHDTPHIGEIGEMINAAVYTAGEIAVGIADKHEIQVAEVFLTLNKIFRHGVIDEEPETVRF
ncbi:MAG TPA: radical SAM family RiPP maturation amino acid epimerase [Candidatus Wallbacteria bacterium]|nr:radical SAM family RiPP maturation amino acid epimerase [Candidatus Wallbacteria bacterium]